VTSSWFFILQLSQDARSNKHQIYRISIYHCDYMQDSIEDFVCVMVLHHSHYQVDHSDSVSCHCVILLSLPSEAFICMSLCYIVLINKWTVSRVFPVIPSFFASVAKIKHCCNRYSLY